MKNICLTHQYFVPIHGFFFSPLHAPVVSNKPGIFYLGNVSATVRERQGEEFKAGPSIPLIDQAIAGASTGTFQIKVSDKWSSDEAKFKERFPILANAVVEKAILPAFDRVKSQKWWEAN